MGEGDNNKVKQESGNNGEGFQDNKKKNKGRIELPEKRWLPVQNKFDKLAKADDKEVGEGDAGKETVNATTGSSPKVDTKKWVKNTFKNPPKQVTNRTPRRILLL